MCNKMSDVRLSNASPTVERVDARQQDSVRPPTRRNLFGTPDREETRRYFEASMQESVQAFMAEYDYDPVDEKPILPPRSYDWKEANDAPEFYRRAPHRRPQPRGEEERPAEDERQGAEERDGRQAETNGSRKRRSGSSGPCLGERQSKRSHSDEEEEENGEVEEERDGDAAEERPSRPENGAEAH